jgi:hypothetical protein
VIASVDVKGADSTSVHCLVRLLMDCVCDSVCFNKQSVFRNNRQVTSGNKKRCRTHVQYTCVYGATHNRKVFLFKAYGFKHLRISDLDLQENKV